MQVAGFSPDGSHIITFDPSTGKSSTVAVPGGIVGKSGLRPNVAQQQADMIDLAKNPPSSDESARAQMIADYHMPLPSGSSAKTPDAIRMRSIVATQYPGYDAPQYAIGQRARQDATSGALGKANNALETATGHLNELNEAAGVLQNGSVQALNALKNKYGLATGATPQTVFQTIQQGLGDELMKTYRGGGSPSEKEAEAFHQLLSGNMSPAQMQAAIGTVSNMLQSKVQANQDQYARGAGAKFAAANPLFASDRQEKLSRLAAQAPPPPPPPSQQLSAPTSPGSLWSPGSPGSPTSPGSPASAQQQPVNRHFVYDPKTGTMIQK